MGFTTPELPDVDHDTWHALPSASRLQVVTRHWVEHGFGTPSAIYLLYMLKMAAYVAGGARAPTGALLGQVSSTSLSCKQNRLIPSATGTPPQASGICRVTPWHSA
jgi:Transmembrane protein of unknown function (DUF3556)